MTKEFELVYTQDGDQLRRYDSGFHYNVSKDRKATDAEISKVVSEQLIELLGITGSTDD